MEEKERLEIAMEVELVGIKNMKSTNVWRLEFDVYEKDSEAVKELFDVINMPLSIGIVGKRRP